MQNNINDILVLVYTCVFCRIMDYKDRFIGQAAAYNASIGLRKQ